MCVVCFGDIWCSSCSESMCGVIFRWVISLVFFLFSRVWVCL